MHRALPSPITVLTGFYGSGKTEVAVNLALSAARDGQAVHLVDLDSLKPCFRSREAEDALRAGGVHLVAPSGPLAHADMPLVPHLFLSLLDRGAGRVVIDLGGDPGGARMLAQFAPVLARRDHELVMVVNAMRPFSSSVERIVAACRELEAATRLRMTALVSNTHLADETTAAIVGDGHRLTRSAAAAMGIPVRAIVIPAFLDGLVVSTEGDETPCIALHRHVRPPWERSEPSCRKAP